MLAGLRARRRILCVPALLVTCGTSVGQERAASSTGPVLVLVSSRAVAYAEAGAALTSVLVARFPGRPVTTLGMEGPEGEDSARRALDSGPAIVVAIGTRAAKLASRSASGPLVYAMVLDPASIGLPAPGSDPARDITGVAMDVTSDQQFNFMRELVPQLSRIGVIYDPAISGDAIRRATLAARSAGLILVGQTVRTEAEVLDAVTLIAPEVDALWTIADPTVLTHANALALILFSLRSRKPLFAMSEGYVRNGALAAVAAHPAEVGRRAAEMVSEILTGTSVRAVRPEMPPVLSVFLNTATARRLGLDLPDSAVSRARMVYPRP